MVMAMGQDRSRPGGPYVTAGLKKISASSSDTVLQKQYMRILKQHLMMKVTYFFFAFWKFLRQYEAMNYSWITA